MKLTLLQTLENASIYQQMSKDKGRWITVGMNHESHTRLKEISSWYNLSLSETLRIIMRNAHNNFVDGMGDKNKNNNTEDST